MKWYEILIAIIVIIIGPFIGIGVKVFRKKCIIMTVGRNV
jgi:hypothetical protein